VSGALRSCQKKRKITANLSQLVPLFLIFCATAPQENESISSCEERQQELQKLFFRGALGVRNRMQCWESLRTPWRFSKSDTPPSGKNQERKSWESPKKPLLFCKSEIPPWGENQESGEVLEFEPSSVPPICPWERESLGKFRNANRRNLRKSLWFLQIRNTPLGKFRFPHCTGNSEKALLLSGNQSTPRPPSVVKKRENNWGL